MRPAREVEPFADDRSRSQPSAPCDQLDFPCLPSHDVAADLAYLAKVRSGQSVFAIAALGTPRRAVD
jgi:hypothetical protein